jgi:hypothetical protein
MTIVAVILCPIVLIYHGWSFHVFGGRVKGSPAVAGPRPAAQSRRRRFTTRASTVPVNDLPAAP